MSDEIVAGIMDFIRSLDDEVAKDAYFAADVDLFDYGYLDSFGIVSLIEFVNRTYGVDLGNVDFYDGPNRTVQGIAALITAAPQGGDKG